MPSAATFPLAGELTSYAPLIAREVGEILACAASAPGARGSWERAALAALANDRRTSRMPSRRAEWAPWYVEEEERARLGEIQERVGGALLARASDKTPVGETTVGGIARVLARALSSEGEEVLPLLRATFGLGASGRTPDADPELYAAVLGPAVTSPAAFAGYLVGFFGGALGGGELAHVIFAGTRVVRPFPKLSRDEMEERLDQWLFAEAPSTNARQSAKRALVALGMTAKAAGALVGVAKVPRKVKLKVTRAALPLPAKPATKPAPAKPKTIRSPWLRSIAALSSRDANAALARRWKEVPKWLRPLRDELLSARVVGPTDEGLLELHHEKKARGYWVAPPIAPSVAQRKLVALGLPPKHRLLELVAAFDGLRDWPPNHAGGLVPAAEMKTVRLARRSPNAWVIRNFPLEELADYRDAVIVYEGGGGDLLLASPKGPIAWAHHDEEELEPAGHSLEDFVRTFIDGATP